MLRQSWVTRPTKALQLLLLLVILQGLTVPGLVAMLSQVLEAPLLPDAGQWHHQQRIAQRHQIFVYRVCP